MSDTKKQRRLAYTLAEKHGEFRVEISAFLDYLIIFARELKRERPPEVASLNAFKVYKKTLDMNKKNCVAENFKQIPFCCSFKKRWHDFMVKRFPNIFLMFLIDTISEMLDVDPVETGIRLEQFIPLLKENLESSEAWKLLCQKPELEMLAEAYELPVVISNLSIGHTWMIGFLLAHFNILPNEIEDWKLDCTALDSAIPIIIRNYARKLLMIKYVLPHLQDRNEPLKINWQAPIPIQLSCPNCHPIINLNEKDWGYIQLHTPDGLKDYHKCNICKRVWAIRHPHVDESLWNFK
ncbi:MAG: hypothetical protein ACTSRC_05580 [Candidatus Helarchaeota archaeon]